MSKVSIIPVDLGCSVDDIISGDIAQLTDRNREEITFAVSQAKKVHEYHQKREEAKSTKLRETDELNAIFDSLYNQMVVAPMLSLDIMQALTGKVSTLSSFSAKMKSYLKNRGNTHFLSKQLAHGCQHYVILPIGDPV